MSPVISGRQLRQWLSRAHNRHVAGPIEHAAVVAQVREDGHFRVRYAFMTLMACGIATLGLLLSSPAVIIGAMLISPLMGPIVLFGFSLCILDLKAMRNSLVALTTGTALAVGASYVIVRISPITQATPEILARTHPNLFDLLVAVFSGLAGGYAVIRRKGETIVGVAIATALMPPLCVVGYGLAAHAPAVAMGAGFLFMTNLLAIALSVTILSKFFGFGADQSPTHTVWQTLLILVTFGALSVPLGVALTRIAIEAQVTNTARATVNDFFSGAEIRVTDFDLAFRDDDQVHVDAIVLTREYRPTAEAELLVELGRRLNRPVSIELDQVLVDQDRALEQTELLRRAETSLTGPLRAQLARYQHTDSLEAEVRDAATFKVDSIDVDADRHMIRVFAAPSPYMDLGAYMEMEAALTARYPDWAIQVVPSTRALPPVLFDVGSAELDAAADRSLAAIAWTLGRWQVDDITVVGFASTAGEARRFDNTSLAYQRAAAVARRLIANGFSVNAAGEYRAFGQEDAERTSGQRSYQRVDVRPGTVAGGIRVDVEPAATSGTPAAPEAKPAVPADVAYPSAPDATVDPLDTTTVQPPDGQSPTSAPDVTGPADEDTVGGAAADSFAEYEAIRELETDSPEALPSDTAGDQPSPAGSASDDKESTSEDDGIAESSPADFPAEAAKTLYSGPTDPEASPAGGVADPAVPGTAATADDAATPLDFALGDVPTGNMTDVTPDGEPPAVDGQDTPTGKTKTPPRAPPPPSDPIGEPNGVPAPGPEETRVEAPETPDARLD